MSYAENTSVSVEKSRAEIETILTRYGANRFAYMSDPEMAVVMFEARGRSVRFHLPLPDRNDKKFLTTPSGKVRRTPADAYKAWEQACRTRWRALCLCIKAKLEAVESGITTFEHEFLAHFVTFDGRTVGDAIIPQLDNCKPPRLALPGSPTP